MVWAWRQAAQAALTGGVWVPIAGLAGCLALLKDRGELSEQVEWSGRTTDIVAAQRLIQARTLPALTALCPVLIPHHLPRPLQAVSAKHTQNPWVQQMCFLWSVATERISVPPAQSCFLACAADGKCTRFV